MITYATGTSIEAIVEIREERLMRRVLSTECSLVCTCIWPMTW